MENENKNQKYYETLPLKEALKEHASCIDNNGNLVDKQKFEYLLKNKELIKYLFSDENLLNNAEQDEQLFLKATSENFLGKPFPPKWYWKMPDYYYAGLYVDNLQGDDTPSDIALGLDFMKISRATSRNEAVLNDCGWKKEKYGIPEYFNDNFPSFKIVFSKDINSVILCRINPETKEEISKMPIPFSLICGIFLKCREYEFDKPWQLRAHDYKFKAPDVFEYRHHIVRDPETHEIIDYGDWKPEEE